MILGFHSLRDEKSITLKAEARNRKLMFYGCCCEKEMRSSIGKTQYILNQKWTHKSQQTYFYLSFILCWKLISGAGCHDKRIKKRINVSTSMYYKSWHTRQFDRVKQSVSMKHIGEDSENYIYLVMHV